VDELEKTSNLYCDKEGNKKICCKKDLSSFKNTELFRRIKRDKDIFDFYWNKADQMDGWKPIIDLPHKKIFH